MAVVDASVTASAMIVTDSLHDPGLRWWRAAHERGQTVHAPAILVSEVTAAVRRLTGDAGQSHGALQSLTADRNLQLIDCDVALCTRAAELAADLGLKGCDSLYVALAERLGEPLVTFDGEQLARAAGVITVTWPA